MARIVLVADDSPTIQKRALGILKGEGFEVETVSNGVAAIKRLAVLRPILVLADVSMPGRDGYEVCEFVKKSPDHLQVPVLLVASDMEPYDDARGAQVKADGIIKKPFEPQELIGTVVKFVEKYEAAMAAPPEPEPPPPAPKVIPAPVREPTQEVPGITEAQYRKPTMLIPIEHDFSSASEGVALDDTVDDVTHGHQAEAAPADATMVYSSPPTLEAPGHYTEPVSTEPEFQYSESGLTETFTPSEAAPLNTEQLYGEPVAEPVSELYLESDAEPPAAFSEPQFEPGISFETAPAAEHVEAPHSTGTAEHAGLPSQEPVYAEEAASSQAAAVSEPSPSYIKGLETAAPEPVFIEEEAVSHVHETPHRHDDSSRTMIFRAPLEIAEPVWSDENVTVSPMPAPAADVAPEPHVEPAPAMFSDEAAVEPAAEHSHAAAPEVIESPESFSTQAATEPVPVAPPAEETWSPEPAPVEPAHEYVAPQEVSHQYSAPVEAAHQYDAPVEAAVHEPEPEVHPEPSASTETPAYEYAAPAVAAPEAAPETPYSEEAFIEMAKEPASSAPVYKSDPPHEPTVEIAALTDPDETAPEAPIAVVPDATEPAFHEAAVDHHSSPAVEEVPAYQHEPVAEAPLEHHPETVAAEPAPQVDQPAPTYDWNLIYAIVHRVVGRMAPPVLAQEAVDHIARQLAEEIATELANQHTHPMVQ